MTCRRHAMRAAPGWIVPRCCPPVLMLCCASVVALAAVAGDEIRRPVDGGALSGGVDASSSAATLPLLRYQVATVCATGKNVDASMVETTRRNRLAYTERHGYALAFETERRMPERDARWEKIGLLQRVLRRAHWTLWLDCDALVMDRDVRIDDLVREYAVENADFTGGAMALTVRDGESAPLWSTQQLVARRGMQPRWESRVGSNATARAADFVVTQDAMGINSGAFLLRNSSWSAKFLDKVMLHAAKLDKRQTGWRDQLAIIKVILRQRSGDHVAIAPQRAFNSYPPLKAEWGDEMLFHGGDFVVHKPGCNGIKGQQFCDALFRLYAEASELRDATVFGATLATPALAVAGAVVAVAIFCRWRQRRRIRRRYG